VTGHATTVDYGLTAAGWGYRASCSCSWRAPTPSPDSDTADSLANGHLIAEGAMDAAVADHRAACCDRHALLCSAADTAADACCRHCPEWPVGTETREVP
jgi:hypothetical protein